MQLNSRRLVEEERSGAFGCGSPRYRHVFPTRKCTCQPIRAGQCNAKAKGGVTSRWHGAGDETIRDIAGHVSRQMLKHYSHIRMEAKRKALESIVSNKVPSNPEQAVEIPTIAPELVAN
jgi:hypothetical protein